MAFEEFDFCDRCYLHQSKLNVAKIHKVFVATDHKQELSALGHYLFLCKRCLTWLESKETKPEDMPQEIQPFRT